VERGFSINKELLVDNMQEKSIIAMRQVYDAVVSAGGILKVERTKKLFAAVKCSRASYRADLERHKEKMGAEKLENVSS